MLNTIAGLLGAGVPDTDYQSISTVTVGAGGSSSIAFTSIPATYSHLQLRYLGRSTYNNAGNGTNFYYTLNSDGAANYSQHALRGDGANTFASGSASQGAMYPGTTVADAGAAASIFGGGVLDILDYANTNKYKTARLLNGFDRNGAGSVALSSGNWRSTAAVTGITISTDGNWAQYTSFALYGIK